MRRVVSLGYLFALSSISLLSFAATRLALYAVNEAYRQWVTGKEWTMETHWYRSASTVREQASGITEYDAGIS